MKIKYLIVIFLVVVFSTRLIAQELLPEIKIDTQEKTLQSQWKGKRIAFLGDSMTDPRRVGTSCIYWEYLRELLGIVPVVYGQNGHQWNGIYNQAKKLNA
ncbi:MAG: SGNH/GDSL hydrolase family protein, partial [Lentimicrobium sp.]|nr:SGNH/GDSL hydrolase family protein [Lentimicrobium sp.]